MGEKMSEVGGKTAMFQGFLTAVEIDDFGLIGGYLLLDLAGRPLEFHCTAPVKPNRAQQILYGPTLTPFLYGEHIGRTLVEKPNVTPWMIVTNRLPMLAVRQFVSLPVAMVIGNATTPLDHLTVFDIGTNRLAVSTDRQADKESILRQCSTQRDVIDMSEPFERIEEAIREAHRDLRARTAGGPTQAAA
jgi:hypothetical protein